MPEFALTPIDLLRILCGLWFLPHLVGKIRNFEKATKTFEAAGLKLSRTVPTSTVLSVVEAVAA